MNKVFLAALLFLPTTTPVPGAQAAPITAGSAQSELRVAYNAIEKALVRKDGKAIAAYQAANFKQRERGVTKNKAQVVKNTNETLALPGITVTSAQFTPTKITLNGNKAKVAYRQTLTAILKRPKQTANFKNISLAEDTWVKTAQGWRVIFTDIKSNNSTLNGKPMN